ncbi:MAG TPA: cytochrome c biogenesis CcdA family protein [Actinomycetaceae bacterium]|nr:cytochrome c biogenesis CcdA family protein [Actinomycetaceae bacterium]
MEVGLLTAFLGGALALLSPCGALLLPGFFASTISTRLGLFTHGALFFAGLAVTLVPLGIGAGALGTILITQRSLLIAAASVLMIGLGLAQALGLGFDPARFLPGLDRLQRRSSQGTGLVRTFLLGAVGGVAGFCAGPILGAVLSLAMGQASLVVAGLLLAVYGAGMVVPLMLLAAVWGRLGPRARGLLRGRTVTVLGRTLHTTSIVTGVLIIALGIVFWTTNGLVTLPSLVSTSTLSRWQAGSTVLTDPIVQVAVIVALALVALLVWWRRKRQGRRPQVGPAASDSPVVRPDLMRGRQ